MYVETMTTEEKIREFKKASDKIHEVSGRILDRYLTKRRMGNNEEIDLGIRKLTVNNTVYYYHTYAVKSPNMNQSRFIVNLSYTFDLYTIQTHQNTNKKYIISFDESFKYWYQHGIGVENRNIITEIEMHLISRYRERFLKDQTLSLDYALQKYVERKNLSGAVCDLPEKQNPKVVGDEVVEITEDGVALGIRVNKDTVKLKTFITEEQLRENQMLWSKYGSIWQEHNKKIEYSIDHPANRGF